MKTRSRWFHLRGLFLLFGGVTLAAMMCASAFAGPSTSRESTIAKQRKLQQQQEPPQPAQRKVVYYVLSSASAIPKPIAWVTGIPTTTTPMDIIGHGYISPR